MIGRENALLTVLKSLDSDDAEDERDWKSFSLSEQLTMTVNTGPEETYFVRFPCSDSIWFKLFLDGETEQNSHIELFSRTRGNIYCNKGGYRNWYGGQRTDFNIYNSWQCDGEFMILE